MPFPYPSIETPKQWEEQARAQCQAGTLIGSHLQMALDKKRFNAQNLQALSQFRNRCGWRLAFLEDPVLDGLLAARSHRGQASRLKQASMTELKKQAAAEAQKTGRAAAIRQLIGPRGGLPTLKGDLIKLAHLVDVQVDEKDTIPVIRAKVQPIAQDIAMTCPAPSAPKAKSLVAPSTPAPASPQPEGAPSRSTWSVLSSPSPQLRTVADMERLGRQEALADQVQFIEDRISQMLENRVGTMLNESENRVQGLLSQVVQHVMAMSSQQVSNQMEPADAEMFPPQMPK